ncbi:uncharacterized protein LOC126581189 [Anopheles aquasalis]|uniref:uncharacterized protein LOC126581189 n=1 Tax=Anopheles aquasalis TaxID=42839 RepID=UPI00215B623D|nr:uncharacterized protein LOC126581189 [Anopheles aquasalis]XP_050100637.1 uncharacterized protein LOC126581189 [Anopheles aquasalis]XP_050100638.1 uncharacterized protein LOC126581189 [Anopheles aquasalis]XP_050100639.1 uncharacterized protein LOC126581189 [Anopheles aquasalis]XP_050100640.1 uncharacterized protein LOC126581189 [Anopheles aquasalis]XP_050100641.1 uncharacterized protein LOC126581189 [Anopheles aquasalis]
MTDALKMTDMQQRASIEFERQRHLANWLIESSPHMPNPTAAQQKQLQQHQQQLQQQQHAQLQQQLAAVAAAAAASGNAGGKKQFAGGKFKPNPMFLLAKIGQNLAPGGAGAVAGGTGIGTATDGSLAAASTFNSQTNLPLQILQPTGGGRDGGKPKLRRFNSHDTSANMFSVAEFENARMARRNELENAALLRQRQRYKLNSLNSSGAGGGDCSTGESKGSKLSTESLTEPLVADQFLERFSLPRVIRLTYTSSSTSCAGSAVSASTAGALAAGPTTGDHTMTSSSSAESSSTAERSGSGGGGGVSKAKSKKATKASASSSTGTTTTTTAAGGDLFLLYRYMKSYKSYHVFNTKAGTSRKKGYKIPQDYPGYFSFINDKGAATATIYTTIVQLVRDQVYKFLSLENLAAYTESHDNFSHKAHYVKATAKAGQVYRLLAVFQDGDHKTASSHKESTGSASDRHVSGREKERGKYAQLLDDNRQIFYVSLSAKGKFYEIEQHSAPVLQKPPVGGNFGNLQQQQQHQGSLTGGGSASSNSINNAQLHRKQAGAPPPRHLSRDCVHRIGFIMQSDVSLPVNLRLISPHQTGPHSTVPEYVTIAKISEENFIVACPLDEQQLTSTLTLTKLHLAPQMKFTKCTMGFESEQHMLLNPNVQTVLKFCQFNCDNFLRIVDHETNAIELQQMVASVQVAAAGSGHPTTVNVSPNTTLTTTTTTTGPSSLMSSASGHHREPKSEMLKVFGRLFGGGGGGHGGSSGGNGSGHDRHSGSGHEKEDSIIFLSKNDLESLECSGREAIEAEHQHHHHHQQQQQHLDHHQHHSLGDRSVRSYDGQGRESGTNQQPHSLPALSASGGFSEKMKVFTPNGGVAGGKKTSSTSRWFKGLGRSVTGGGHQGGNGPVSADDEWDKRTSLDRYKDMSKLIQERFGTLALSSRAHSDILGGAGYDDTGAPMSTTGTLVSLNPAASSADMTMGGGGYGSDTLVSGGSAGGGGSVGMQKSRSLQHIEHQQQQQQHMARGQKGRNRPDLVTNLSGSVDGDTIHTFDPDDADRLSELEGDTLIFPLRHSSHQQSFMTQKLYNEFHVKTKQHSKSSSSIQQLLHLASGGGGGGASGKVLGSKQRASGRQQQQQQQRHCNEVILSFDDLRYMNSEEAEEQERRSVHRNGAGDASRRMRQAENRMSAPLPAPPKVLEDDLPYSSVRDSIMIHDDPQQADDDGESVPTESIYAEICADHGPTTTSPTATTSSGCSTGSTGSSSSNGNRMAPSLATSNQHTVTISTGGVVRSSEKRFVSIRINVPPCDAGPVSLNPAGGATVTVRGGSSGNSSSSNNSSRCSSTVSSPIEDNIYNTIK